MTNAILTAVDLPDDFGAWIATPPVTDDQATARHLAAAAARNAAALTEFSALAASVTLDACQAAAVQSIVDRVRAICRGEAVDAVVRVWDAGTGKTTAEQVLLHTLRHEGVRCIPCAPTGAPTGAPRRT